MTIAELRRTKGLTQQELSETSGVKIVTIQKLENGQNSIWGAKVSTLYMLAKALDVHIEDFLPRAEAGKET